MSTLQKINDKLTKGMIAIFVAIIPLSLMTIILPVLGFVVAGLIVLLGFIVIVNFVLGTFLMAHQIAKMVDQVMKQYEQEQRRA